MEEDKRKRGGGHTLKINGNREGNEKGKEGNMGRDTRCKDTK